jgi:Tfp pilus assembly protein PilN
MRAVNLLPRDVQRSALKPTAPILTGVVGGIVVTTVLCAGFLLQSAKVAEKRNELDAARAELALVPPPATQHADNGAAGLAAEEAQRVTALQGAISGRVAWDRILREISLVLPKDVWLTTLSLAAPDPAGDINGRQFSIAGNAYSHDGVARLLSRIALIPDLANVQLGSSNKLVPGATSTVSWTISARIRVPGSSS